MKIRRQFFRTQHQFHIIYQYQCWYQMNEIVSQWLRMYNLYKRQFYPKA